jgi:hypothetical protein
LADKRAEREAPSAVGDPAFHLQHRVEPLLPEPGEGGAVLGRAAIDLREAAIQFGVLASRKSSSPAATTF